MAHTVRLMPTSQPPPYEYRGFPVVARDQVGLSEGSFARAAAGCRPNALIQPSWLPWAKATSPRCADSTRSRVAARRVRRHGADPPTCARFGDALRSADMVLGLHS